MEDRAARAMVDARHRLARLFDEVDDDDDDMAVELRV